MNILFKHKRSLTNNLLTFDESINLINSIQKRESDNNLINPISKSILFSHNKATTKVAVLYHGYTNTPKQFELLGSQLFAKGYNIYIPRLKYNGHKSRTSRASRKLEVADLMEYVDSSIQIAQGLGSEIEVIGLSGGGTLALWAGFLYKLRKVVAIAPTIDPMYYRQGLRSIVIAIFKLIPNLFIWWESDVKEKIDSPVYAYAWFSSKAMVRFLSLAEAMDNALKTLVPETKSFVFILTEGDKSSNPIRLGAFMEKLVKHNIVLRQIVFKKSEGIHHDMIDPNQLGQKVNIVYPKIMEALGL